MRHKIEVRTDPGWPEYEELLMRAAVTALEHESAENGAMTVVLTDAESMRELNRTFAGDDYPTDVLSFVDGTIDPESGLRYFGDVIIAVDIATDQADQAGHSLSSELKLLVAHGVLHLLGHDHAGAEEKKRMWSAQTEILDSLENHPAERQDDP
jgi:probable rRNA maturation factor